MAPPRSRPSPATPARIGADVDGALSSGASQARPRDVSAAPARRRSPHPSYPRDPAPMLEAVTREWDRGDLWVFAYASLIWRPEFAYAEERFASIQGYHRALKMWSRVNRGTPDCPGLVFGLLPGGSCRGMAFRIPAAEVPATLPVLWAREMPNGVYDPKWLRCRTAQGDVRALAFTLSPRSPSHTGVLSEDRYRQIFSDACGRFGTTREYAQLTYDKLRSLGIHDKALGKLLTLARP